ncbi:hypothetical protein [Paeniglutamicibacter sp. NPDC091659]|uniref:hypothetical protein n=1 Tax=Paeniglutamicibacter sp. NPDC091659 TaxID=3364389 RepID=UPI00380D4360
MVDSSNASGNASSAAEPEGTLEEIVLEHDDKLEHLHATLQDQQKTLAALVKHLEQPGSSPAPQDPAPWNLGCATAAQRRHFLGQLSDWINWYNETYPGVEEHVIPPCWFHHSAVVQELVAMFVAWQAAYCGSDEPNDAPAYWHDRILHPTIKRLSGDKAAGWGNCLGAHREPRRPDTGRENHLEFREWLESLTHRSDSAADKRFHG